MERAGKRKRQKQGGISAGIEVKTSGSNRGWRLTSYQEGKESRRDTFEDQGVPQDS